MAEPYLQKKTQTNGILLAWGFFLLALAVFLGVILCTAWLNDDAFITFRVSDNLVNGHGARWNTVERVQSYTNPLWMLLVTGVYAVTKEMYYTPLLMAMIFSLAAVLLITVSLRRNAWSMLGVLMLFIASRAFMDYSTSGLENPLTHLLLAVFFILLFRGPEQPRTLLAMSFVAHVCLVNRMDTLLLAGPALAWAWWRQRSWRATAAVIIGMAPFITWELFSLVYYGFPFPNTAYAKLGGGLSRLDLLRQGAAYFKNSLHMDHVTLPALFLVLVLALIRSTGKGRSLALGILAYLAYTLWVGGDFMSGRFFATPLFCAAALLVQMQFLASPKAVSWTFAVLLVLSPYVPNPTAYLGGQKELSLSLNGNCDGHGIANERSYYYQNTGLIPRLRGVPFANTHQNAHSGREVYAQGYRVIEGSAVGMLGFFAGPEMFVIDNMGLGDPLLSRLPAQYFPFQRPGHYLRYVPPGYARILQNPESALDDPRLNEYLKHLWTITRGPLWSLERWKTILAMNLGHYDHLIDTDVYRFPLMKRLTLNQLNTSLDRIQIESFGMDIALEEPVEGKSLTLQLDADDRYDVLFMKQTEILGKITLGPAAETLHGLVDYTFPIPKGVRIKDCTSIRIIPWSIKELFWVVLPHSPDNEYYAVRHLYFNK